MTRSLLAGFVIAAACGAVWAGPIDKAVVAKSAQWVVHVDLEAIAASKVGTFLLSHRAAMNIEELDQVKKEFGLDPLTDIKGLTVYGGDPEDNEGVAIVYTTAAVDGCIEKIRAKEKGVQEITLGGFKAYTWTEGETTKFAQVRPDGAGRVVIAASGKDLLLSGIAVYEGKAESAKAGMLADRTPRHGSFVYAVAAKLPHAEAMPFKNADGIVLDAGESEREFYADVDLTAKTSEEATRLTQVAVGALAFAKIGLANNPEYKDAMELVDGISVTCDGAKIVGKFRYPCDKIMQALQDIQKQKAGHKRKTVKVKGEKHDDDGNGSR